MKIDLNTCKPGDDLKLRNGGIATYMCRGVTENISTEYVHSVLYKYEEQYYISNGHYYCEGSRSPYDVVKIIRHKSKEPKPKKDKCDRDAIFLHKHAILMRGTHHQWKRLAAIIRRLNGGKNVD